MMPIFSNSSGVEIVEQRTCLALKAIKVVHRSQRTHKCTLHRLPACRASPVKNDINIELAAQAYSKRNLRARHDGRMGTRLTQRRTELCLRLRHWWCWCARRMLQWLCRRHRCHLQRDTSGHLSLMRRRRLAGRVARTQRGEWMRSTPGCWSWQTMRPDSHRTGRRNDPCYCWGTRCWCG